MTEFKLIAYEKENGEVPVEEFLDSVNPKMRAKIFGLLGILQEKGNMLREPYSKHLDDGIFELRCKFGSLELVKELLLQATVYVYEDNYEIQGFIGMNGEYIEGIFVSEAMQSQGIGKILLNYVMVWQQK